MEKFKVFVDGVELVGVKQVEARAQRGLGTTYLGPWETQINLQQAQEEGVLPLDREFTITLRRGGKTSTFPNAWVGEVTSYTDLNYKIYAGEPAEEAQ